MPGRQTQIATLFARITLQLTEAITGLRDIRSRLDQSTSSIKNLRDQSNISAASVVDSFKKMTAGASGLGKGTGTAAVDVGTAFKKIGAAGKTLGAGAIGAAFGVGLAEVGKTALTASADYEKSMGVFKLVTGASGAEVKKAQGEIEKLAHDMSLPQFSKADAAEALLTLSRNGMTASDAVKALHPALLLAAAGEVSAMKGAELLAGTMQSFAIPAGDASKVADELAAAMKFAGLDFTQLSDTVKNAGPTFASAGIPLDVFLTLVGELGQKGIKGAEAGTVLKDAFLSLLAPGSDALAMLRGMGVHVYELGTNKIRPLRDIIGDLHDAFVKLNPAQQEFRAKTIFGSTSAGAMLQIIKDGLPAYDAMHAKITQAGIAQEVATAKSEGLSGAIAGLKKESVNATMAALAPMIPVLTDILRGLSALLVGFQALPGPVQAVVGVLLLALPALAGFGYAAIGVKAGLTALGLIAPAAAGAVGGLVPAAAGAGGAIAGVGEAAVAAEGGLGGIATAAEGVGGAFAATKVGGKTATTAAEDVAKAFEGTRGAGKIATTAVEDVAKSFEGTQGAGKIAMDAIENVGGSLVSTKLSGQTAKTAVGDVTKAFEGTLVSGKTAVDGVERVGAAFEKTKLSGSTATEFVGAVDKAMAHTQVGGKIATTAVEDVGSVFGKFGGDVLKSGETVGQLEARLGEKGLAGAAKGLGKDIIQSGETVGQLEARFSQVEGPIAKVASHLSLASVATDVMSVAQGALNLVMSLNPIALVVLAIVALVAGLVLAYQNCQQFRDIVDAAFAAVGAAATSMWTVISTAFGNITSAIGNLLSSFNPLKALGINVNLGGGGQVQARAGGGPVGGGQPYVVGEKGPELFVPGGSGMIVPSGAFGAGGGSTSVTNVHFNGPVYGWSDLQKIVQEAVHEGIGRGQFSTTVLAAGAS